MSSIISKSNSFKRFRSNSENTTNADSESVSSAVITKPKLFSKKSIKLFSSSNNTTGNLNDTNTNSVNKNIVVRLNDFNNFSSPNLPIIKGNMGNSSTNLRVGVKTRNMSLGRSLSQNLVSPSTSAEFKSVYKLESDLEIPSDFLSLLKGCSTESNLINITLFGKEDRRLKESLILKDNVNFGKISKLLEANKNKKLHITNFDTLIYVGTLEKIMLLEIDVLEFFITKTNSEGWVSYKEITELKQRLNHLINSWQKRIDFYKENLVLV
ncbi:hypothetical protein QEN19_001154 [Hanseniaspora menglaensis]